jgi:tRNA threonylcarbamoyladenosine biosynthesis protein TsaB
MSTILAIETSTEIASAALLHDGSLSVLSASGVQNHSHTLLPMVQTLLQQANLRLGACNAIAFGVGPGSFTGVRTACGVAQGLAFGLGLPVVPIHTLLAMAQACHLQTGALDILPILDARMGEVYWAQYRFDQQTGWQTIVPPTLSAPAGVVPQGVVQACGNGVPICASLSDFTSNSASNPTPPDWLANAEPQIMPHAAQIAQLGKLAFEAGMGLAAEAAQPLYLRNNVAKTSAERALSGVQR